MLVYAAQIVEQAHRQAGDGAATAVVLAQAMVNQRDPSVNWAVASSSGVKTCSRLGVTELVRAGC